MTKLSVNINKIALLRNSRGNNYPNIIRIIKMIYKSGCRSITVHPREDERHIKLRDIELVKKLDFFLSKKMEINVEGDLRENLIKFLEKKPYISHFTIVPVAKNELTTTRGWKRKYDNNLYLKNIIKKFRGKFKISLFCEPEVEDVKYISNLGVDSVEFHTKWYAKEFGKKKENFEIKRLIASSREARLNGLKVHLGHDLNLVNLYKISKIIKPDEVSIGHSLLTEIIYSGISKKVNDYINILKK